MSIKCDSLQNQFPCRENTIQTLFELCGNSNEALPNAIYFNGHAGTGKTAIIKAFMKQHATDTTNMLTVYINSVESYTTKILLENILEEFNEKLQNKLTNASKCDTLKEFVEQLRSIRLLDLKPAGYLLALDNAERLRDMDANILPALIQLQQLSALNICVILISQLPLEKYYCQTGLPEVICLYLKQYSKADTARILGMDLEKSKLILKQKILKNQINTKEDQQQAIKLIDNITVDFYNNYLNVFLSVFYKACRDVPELMLTSRKCFMIYMEPILDGSIEPNDVSRLWRHIAGPLRSCLSQVYNRLDSSHENVIYQ